MKKTHNKFLIINADDYGLDKAACEAIIELANEELISSTSILANMATADQLKAISENKNISTGWHINLVEGKPVSDPDQIPSLVNKKGEFMGSKLLMKKGFYGKVKQEDIRTEMNAQYLILKDMGIDISHADAHQHSHQLPVVGPFIMEVLKDLGIARIRFGKVSDKGSPRMKLLSLFRKMNSGKAGSFASPEVLVTSLSTGILDIHKLIDELERSFRKYECVEVMTHPAKDNSKTYLDRVGELQLWKSDEWNEYLQDSDIELIPYSRLPITDSR